MSRLFVGGVAVRRWVTAAGVAFVGAGGVRRVRSGVKCGRVLGGKRPAFGRFPADARNPGAKVTDHRRPTYPTTHPSKYATTTSGDQSNKANNPSPAGLFSCAET